MSWQIAAIGGDLLHQGVDQAVPCEFGRLDRDVPTQAQQRSPKSPGSDSPAGPRVRSAGVPFRQKLVQPLGDRRAGQRDPVDRAVQDPLDDRVGQRLGVGVVVDGDLVDIGQLFEFVLEERTSSIGAGQQDFAARWRRGPRLPRAPPSDNCPGRDRREGDSRRGPPRSPDRSPRVSGGPGHAGRDLAHPAAARKTERRWPT